LIYKTIILALNYNIFKPLW